MKILIIDNFDSFTFNLYQTVGEILEESGTSFKLDVKRNNELTLAEIRANQYDRIIISPGPGEPSDMQYFGICGAVIRELGRTVPVFGVCLGMQGIGHVFGGMVALAPAPRHGKTSLITHAGRDLFAGLPQELEVMRYHSLVVGRETLPDCLEVTAQTVDEGHTIIMALKHREYPIVGVQFHPESFATEGGRRIIKNFLAL